MDLQAPLRAKITTGRLIIARGEGCLGLGGASLLPTATVVDSLRVGVGVSATRTPYPLGVLHVIAVLLECTHVWLNRDQEVKRNFKAQAQTKTLRRWFLALLGGQEGVASRHVAPRRVDVPVRATERTVVTPICSSNST